MDTLAGKSWPEAQRSMSADWHQTTVTDGSQFELTLADGYRRGTLSSDDYRLVLGGQWKTMELADLSLTRRQPLQGAMSDACPMVCDSERGLIYVADDNIKVIRLADQVCEDVLKRPTVEVDPRELEDRLRSTPDRYKERVEADIRAGDSNFCWLLGLSPDCRQLVAHLSRNEAPSLFMHLDLETSEVRSFPVERTTGLSADFRKQWVALPGGPNGPRILDFQGNTLFDCSVAPAHFRRAAIHPTREVVALGSSWATLALWHMPEGTWDIIDERGNNPAWSPEGDRLWYTRGDNELWEVDQTGTPRPLVILEPTGKWVTNAEQLLGRPIAGFAHPPVPSPCGRYLFAELSHEGASEPEYHQHVFGGPPPKPYIMMMVVDLQDRIVHAVGTHPGREDTAWL